jgi:putative flippase GtrA
MSEKQRGILSRIHLISLARQHETKLRFLVAGGLNTVFGLAIYPFLMWQLAPWSKHYLLILTLAQILGVTFAFTTNKFLVFRTKGHYLREFGKFSTFHVIYFCVNLVVLPILVEFVHISPVWGQYIFNAGVIVTSYFWHSHVTFKHKKT